MSIPAFRAKHLHPAATKSELQQTAPPETGWPSTGEQDFQNDYGLGWDSDAIGSPVFSSTSF
jgi:hypothetical protein